MDRAQQEPGWESGEGSGLERTGENRARGRWTRPNYADLVRRYGFALLTVAMAGTAAELRLFNWEHGTLSIVCFLAVVLSSWYGGLRPGLLAIAVIVCFFSNGALVPWRIVRGVLFVASGVAVSVLGESLHAARRRAETSQRRFAAVLSSIGDAVIATDLGGRVQFINPVAQALTGWTAAEAAGQPLETIFRIVSERTREPVGSPIARVIRQETVLELPNQSLLIARNGVETPIADSAAPIKDDAGRVNGAVLVFRDITAQHVAERQRSELLAREQAARAEAEAANHAKDRFLAVLSHELRTPLTPVLLNVSAILEEPDVPEKIRPTLELTRRNVELEAHLIDDLLDLSRIIRGTLALDRQRVDVHDVIRQALNTCHEDIERGGLRVELALSAAQRQLEADPARLQQALWNLIKNAVKFTPAGGVLTITTRNDSGSAERERIVIEVTDTGVGIKPQNLARIFEAFEQGDASSWSRRAGGLGLGLAISRSVVEAHGGRLTATSAGLNRGATFTIELDTAPPQREPCPTPGTPHQPTPPRQELTLLIVEDDEPTLRALAGLLRHRGYTVFTAPNFAEGLAIGNREQPDLLISDLGLPDGNGLDLMRSLSTRRSVLGIALSGYGMDDDVKKSREAGFAAHLTKPIDFQRLEAMIQAVAQ
jgi:PAS domain S-box-containing protein